jgi:hypothetical protein
MPVSGDDARIARMAADAAEAVRRLKSLEPRVNRIEQAVQPNKIRPDKLAEELEGLQQQLKLLQFAQQEMAAAAADAVRRQAEREACWQDAAEQTAAAQRASMVVDEVFSAGLPAWSPAFTDLEDNSTFEPFDPGPLGVPEPPVVPGVRPQKPRLGFLGGNAQHERDMEDWHRRHEAAEEARSQRESERLRQLREKEEQHGRAKAEHQARKSARNAEVARMRAELESGEPAAVRWLALEALRRSPYPDWYPFAARRYQVTCRPDRDDVFIELELPGAHVIPRVQSYYGLTGGAGPLAVPRPLDDVRQQYAALIAAIGLRTVNEVFAATQGHAALVRAVTLNGRVSGFDPATGKAEHRHLLSLRLSRADLDGLDLRYMVPLDCLGRLDARISADPMSLLPVEPLEPFPEP